jgi:hypothetical protein
LPVGGAGFLLRDNSTSTATAGVGGGLAGLGDVVGSGLLLLAGVMLFVGLLLMARRS